MAINPNTLKRLPVATLLLALFNVTSCGESQTQSMEQERVGFTKEGTLEVLNQKGDSILARFDIEFAESDYEIQTGLMYREKMEANEGMFFIFQSDAQHSFYMKNTLIPLDLLFIRSDSSIARIAKNAKPLDETSIPSGEPVRFVFEINAGRSTQLGIQEGDKISWKR